MPIKAKILLLGFFLILVIFRIFSGIQTTKFNSGEKVQLEGYLLEEPSLRGNLSFFSFQGLRVVTTENLHYGDKIKIEGEVDGNKIAFPVVQKLNPGSLLGILTTLRREAIERINRLLPEPQASFLRGVLLGDKSELDSDLRQELIRTGTIHVIVVSGFNITLVGGFVLLLAKFIKRRNAVLLSIFAIVLYILIVGISPPTLRAAVMGIVAYSASLLGRVVYPLYLLIFAALVLMIFDPKIISDVGFQLSFLATAGILIFGKIFEDKIRRLPSFLSSSVSTSLGAQILVVPLIFFYFGNISLVSPLVNAAVVWTIPLVTIIGFVIVFISFIYFPIAALFTPIIYLAINYFLVVVDRAAQIPFASVQVEPKNVYLLIGYYLLVLALQIYFQKSRKKKYGQTS